MQRSTHGFCTLCAATAAVQLPAQRTRFHTSGIRDTNTLYKWWCYKGRPLAYFPTTLSDLLLFLSMLAALGNKCTQLWGNGCQLAAHMLSPRITNTDLHGSGNEQVGCSAFIFTLGDHQD